MPATPANSDNSNNTSAHSRGAGQGFLDWVEWLGNKLPDPAALFVLALIITWIVSAWLAPVEFAEVDPRTVVKKKPPQAAAEKVLGIAGSLTQPLPMPAVSVGVTSSLEVQQEPKPIRVKNQLTGKALATFLSKMVKTFTDFHPLGVVLVALLGVGVAEHTGFINAALKGLLSLTPAKLLTPMLILVAIISHTAGDTGYVLVIPLGGVIYYAAGRHPLAGIAAAFAGVSGGFSANFIPSGLDPLLQGITQQSAQLLAPERTVNPLCNWFFTSVSCAIIIGFGWYLTDRIIEPRLKANPVDGDPAQMPTMDPMTPADVRGLWAGLAAMAVGLLLLVLASLPADSPLRNAKGELAGAGAPLMAGIVPLIFLLFLFPGIVYGYVAGTVKSHRDIIKGMSKSMSTMGYYLVMAFFAAQFIYAFGESNLGALIAVKGANLLIEWRLPPQITIVGIILISATINLLIGSASAKWALLGPVFVPMLMALGISPELTQAAYRIGDSSTNIITPLMPYFPLVVVYSQRYVKNTGIGTLIALMIPYSATFLISWTLLLLGYWALEIPLGLQAPYTYVP